MQMETVRLVYFSPTGTSRSIVQAIARGMGQDNPLETDITMPEARKQSLRARAGETLIVAAPVYGGRLPALVEDWLRGMRADGALVVCVVVYGNRAFEDALLEMKDIVKQCGGAPVAGAAFIGEHSFSSADAPIAVSRPDADDLSAAETFGRRVRETLDAIASSDVAPELQVPGDFPYKERKDWRPKDFIAVSDACVQCGICVEACPVEAIDAETYDVNYEKCIRCCACIKICPERARGMNQGPVKDIAMWLNENCAKRKEPEFFGVAS